MKKFPFLPLLLAFVLLFTAVPIFLSADSGPPDFTAFEMQIETASFALPGLQTGILAVVQETNMLQDLPFDSGTKLEVSQLTTTMKIRDPSSRKFGCYKYGSDSNRVDGVPGLSGVGWCPI